MTPRGRDGGGVIRIHDTTVSLWEEPTRPMPFDYMKEPLQAMLGRLRFRGWKMKNDTSVGKSIRSLYWLGRLHDMHCRVEGMGRTISFAIWQETNTENANGGRYDYNKIRRMNRMQRLRCIVEMAGVVAKLQEMGHSLGPRIDTSRGLLATVRDIAEGNTNRSPLEVFNASWNSEYDWARGGRFERDETGWPSAKELGFWPSLDRDRVPVRTGEVRYMRERGRLVRGIAYPNMNGMWMLFASGTLHYVSARDLFFCDRPDQEPRRHVAGQEERLRAEIEKAMKARDYRRTATLAKALERACRDLSEAA